MGGMVVMMRWKNWSLPLKLRAQKHSTSSPRSLTVVWKGDLCSPSPAASSWPVQVNPNVWCSPDDKEVDVWAAVVRGSVVVVSCVIPLVVGLCVSAGNAGSTASLPDRLRSVDKICPDSRLVFVLLVGTEATLGTEEIRG